MLRAMKEKTAMTVNMTVGISITTAEPTFVPKKEMVAIQPLQGEVSCETVQHGEEYPVATPLEQGTTSLSAKELLRSKGPTSVVQEAPFPMVQEMMSPSEIRLPSLGFSHDA